MTMSQMMRSALRIRRTPGEPLTYAPPCVDSYGADKILLNREYRKAMNIPEKVIDFSMCNNDEDFKYIPSKTGSYWIYQKLIPLNKYKIVIYSGDADPCVPYSGTITWINKIRKELNLPTEEYWRTWYTSTENGRQNSGKVWTLGNNFKLVTFKGVGHMAPQFNY